MSKEIDLTQPLSAEDEIYVRDRPWLLEDARLQGLEVAFASDEPVDPDPDQDPDDDTDPDGDDASDEPDGSDELVEEDDAEEVPPYSEWEDEALKDELKVRDLSVTGKRETLIARLEKDDQK